MRHKYVLLCLVLLATTSLVWATGNFEPGSTTLVTKSASGNPFDTGGKEADISADGNLVAFGSRYTMLLPPLNGSLTHMYVRNLASGVVKRASVATGGTPANGESFGPVISADGRILAFTSIASNLVSGDTNDNWDVFVHDLATGTTSRVSLASDGSQAQGRSIVNDLSADGQLVLFTSSAANLVAGDNNATFDLFLHNRQTGQTTRLGLVPGGEPNGATSQGALSGDGNFVALASDATNLVPNDTNGVADVFLFNRQTGQVLRISEGPGGVQSSGHVSWLRGIQGVSIAADGRYVSFSDSASNLVANDTNNTFDIFTLDVAKGKLTRDSVASSGTQSIAASISPHLSSDGRYVLFSSSGNNLVAGDTNGVTDVFLRDRFMSVTTRVSISSAGLEADAESAAKAISANGQRLVFESIADNLWGQDSASTEDIFLHVPMPGDFFYTYLPIARRQP